MISCVSPAIHEPVAIIGMGCRFPGGAAHPRGFWRLLDQGVDAVSDIPDDRWDAEAYYDPQPQTPGKMYTRRGAFLDNVYDWDPQVFNVSVREAVAMDPQQRLLLEVTWEAIEDAGVPIHTLAGSRTGVFVGTSCDDYAQLILRSNCPTHVSAYTSLGTARSVSVGRIAYVFGLQGPVMQIDTACSSSLVAVHKACQSLRNHESDLAFAGGVNLMLSPHTTIGFCQLKALSPDGRCKTFDANADGYGRGEGCGVVVLKRLSQAIHDGDHVVAIIKGSAVNHNGRSNGLAAPNGAAQTAVIQDAISRANVDPAQIGYVETHGTGTVLGDPIELLALDRALGQRDPNQRVCIGSVKTNIGHLEAAAGVAGIIKTAMALRHGAIPAHLNMNKPNPRIPWDRLRFDVPPQTTPWPTPGPTRLAGVSCFGMSGTNVHMILAAPHDPVSQTTQSHARPKRHLLMLSAKTDPALRAQARQYQSFLQNQQDTDLANVCASAANRRTHFAHRLAISADNLDQARRQLDTFAQGRNETVDLSNHVSSCRKPQVAWLFTGQGAQHHGMAHDLYHNYPLARQILDHCDEVLAEPLQHSLLDLMDPQSNNAALLDQTRFAQPAIFVVEYALARLWQSWGLGPDVMLGHSIGQCTAACIAGVIDLDDALHWVAERGRLMQSQPGHGRMAAVFASEPQVVQAIQSAGEPVTIAAVNSPTHTVICGDHGAIERTLESLNQQGMTYRLLNVSHAFHSGMMADAACEFASFTQSLTLRPAQIPLICNLDGQLADRETLCDPAYWGRHIQAPVHFWQGLTTLTEMGTRLFLEIGPDAHLTAIGTRAKPSPNQHWLCSLVRDRLASHTLLECLKQFYLLGVPLDWDAVHQHQNNRPIKLPSYPFQRQRYRISFEDHHPPQQQAGYTDTATPADPVEAGRADHAQPAPGMDKADEAPPNPAADPQSLADQVVALISRILQCPASYVTPASRLCSQLGMDSLMFAQLQAGTVSLAPATGGISMEYFIQDATVQDVIDHLNDVSQGYSHTGSANVDLDLQSALAAIHAWEQHRGDTPHPPLDRSLVHKADAQNVLISRVQPLPGHSDVFLGEIYQHLTHPFFYEHPKDHVPGLYLIEAIRQFGTALSHLHYDVPMDDAFILDDMQVKFHSFAETSRPLFVICLIQNKRHARGRLEQMRSQGLLVQNQQVIGTANGTYKFMAASRYSSLRQPVS